MTKEYIGVKAVTAWPEERDGKPGYAIKYSDGYSSWSPRGVFEAAYVEAKGDDAEGISLMVDTLRLSLRQHYRHPVNVPAPPPSELSAKTPEILAEAYAAPVIPMKAEVMGVSATGEQNQ